MAKANAKPVNKTASITQNKKMITAVNKLLKEHNLAHFKVFEIALEPRTTMGLTQNCSTLVCRSNERKVEVRKPNGTIECVCKPR